MLAPSRVPVLFILFSRILYTKRGQRQMNFLSKNMSFLIISVSTLNYLPLEHFSPLHFPSNSTPRSTPCHPPFPTHLSRPLATPLLPTPSSASLRAKQVTRHETNQKLCRSRLAVTKHIEPAGRVYQGAKRPQRSGKPTPLSPSPPRKNIAQNHPPFAPRGHLFPSRHVLTQLCRSRLAVPETVE